MIRSWWIQNRSFWWIYEQVLRHCITLQCLRPVGYIEDDVLSDCLFMNDFYLFTGQNGKNLKGVCILMLYLYIWSIFVIPHWVVLYSLNSIFLNNAIMWLTSQVGQSIDFICRYCRLVFKQIKCHEIIMFKMYWFWVIPIFSLHQLFLETILP